MTSISFPLPLLAGRSAGDGGNWIITAGGAAAAAATVSVRFVAGATGGYSNNDKVFVVPVAAVADAELLLRQTFGAVETESYMEYALRSSGTDPLYSNSYCVVVSNTDVQLFKSLYPTDTVLFENPFTSLGLAAPSNGSAKWIRFRVQGTTVAFKVWDDGTAEPSEWTYSTTDSSVTGGQIVVAIAGGSAAASGVNYVDQFYVISL